MINAFDQAVCVVSGAASGLGRALAQELALQGAILELWDIDSEGLAQTHAGLETAAQCSFRVLDVGDWEAVNAAAAEIAGKYARIDYIFNNAAIALSATVANAEISEYQQILKTNVLGVIHGSKAFLPFFLAQGSGQIVNVSSILANVATPTQSAYCATKAAVSSFTNCLARELTGSGIRVSLVLPAGLNTNMANNALTGRAAGALEARVQRIIGRKMRGDPRKAARRLLRGVASGRLRIFTSTDAWCVDICMRLFPAGHLWLWRRILGI